MCVGSTEVPFLMCTLEIPQKLQHKFLLLTFSYLLYFLASLSTMISSMSLSFTFVFCSFQSYGSFNHINSTSLSFSEFSELFTSIFLLAKHIESHHLPRDTSDIIMSVLQKSSMFIASLCILDVP